MRGHRRIAVWSLLCGIVATLSCDSPLSPDGPTVDRIEVNPISLTIVVGETGPVTARVIDGDGKTDASRRVFWTTQNAAIATVSQTGVVSGVATGATQIAASSGGKSTLVPVTVNARPVSQVRLSPTTATVQAGATTALVANPVDATGTTVPGRTISWNTSAPAIATVTSQGVVAGIAPGTATISATVDGVAGTAVVTVTAVPVATVTITPTSGSLVVGQTLQLSAATASATGQTLTGRVVTWTSSASSVASVSSTGLVSAVAAGTATITATSEGRTATVQITVSAIPVALVRVTPSTETIASGQTSQLAAQAFDAAGNVLNRTVSWATDQPNVATVSQTGLVTAVNAGVARITASVGSVSGTSTVTVTAVPVASLTISPNGGSIAVGARLQLTATAKDAAGVTLPNRQVTWISGATSIATVTQAGLVTAIGPGSATIFAASEGIAAQVNVTVSNIAVAAVRVTPATGSMQQGQSIQLAATALDANNNVLTGRNVAWSSSNETIASVSSTGRVLGVTPGTATITATIDGVTGTGQYSVSQVPIGAITLAPATATVLPGATVTLTPSLTGTNGLPQSTVGRTIIWSSSNTAIATVNQSGVVTGVAQGNAVITATTEGVSATSSITVSSTPIATITVTPNPANVQEANAAPVALVATARDAGGNILTGRTFFWSSDNPLVSVNSSTGAVTALVGSGGGSATITASAPGAGVGGTTPTGTTAVNASYAPVASAIVTPNVATLSVGSILSLSLAISASGGQTLAQAGRTITWSSLTPALATVNTSGVVTGVASGTAQIEVSALSPGQSAATAAKDTAFITVQNAAPVQTVTFTLAPDSTIIPGTPLGGTVTVRDAANNLLQGRTVSLTSSNTGIATVTPASGTTNAAGQITGVSVAAGSTAGNATITAMSEGKTAQVTARILAPVNSVTVSATPDSVIGTSTPIQAQATLRDAASNVLTGRPVTWGPSSNAAVATVNTSGLISVVGLGSANIPAQSEGKSGTMLFRVLPPVNTVNLATAGDSIVGTGILQVTPTLRDAANNILTGRPITWSSSNALIATVASNGRVTGASAGTVTITASVEGKSNNVVLRILAGINTIALTPATDSIIGVGTLPLTATATASGGGAIQGRPLTITTSNATIATAAAAASNVTNVSGQVALTVTSVANGSANITVAAEGKSGVRTIRVLAPVNTVSLTTPGDSIIGTGTLQATATLRDLANNVLTGRPVTWNPPSNAAVASISATGLVTGVAPGTTTVTATSEGKTSPAITIRVLAPVSTVTVAASDTLYVTQTQTGTATLKDASNNTLTGRPVSWSTSAATIATVSATTGLITGVAPGNVTITATAEGVNGTKNIVIIPTPVNTLTFTPNTETVNVAQTKTIVLEARDLNNNLALGRTCSIVSGNTAQVTVSPPMATTDLVGQVAVMVTGVLSTGSTPVVITATCEGKTGTANITVP